MKTNSQAGFIPIMIALVVALGLGGTVALANNSGPGDPLFGIDRAVENLRLSLANKEKKNELRIAFADERIKEVKRITSNNSSMSRPASTDITESTVSRIEANVFTNETVIKIEYSGSKKFVFTSDAKTKVLVIEDIVKNFGSLSKAFVDAKLDFEMEDRPSREDDKGSSSNSSDDNLRVATGINVALALLNGVSASVDGESAVRLKLITDELNKYLDSLPIDSTVDTRINSSGEKTRIDLRTVDGLIRVEIKDDGEIKIKTKNDDKNSNNDDLRKGRDSDDDDDEIEDDDDDRGAIVPLPPVPAPIVGGTVKSYSLTDVKLHNTKSGCWTAVNGSVYDVTSWISQHPGGASAIVGMCGIDASSAFNAQHGGQARPASELASFKIGVLK